MLEHRFDEILDFLCSGIISKIEREEMRDELYDHLMTKYEINLAVGMDEEQAVNAAISALGNREKLKDSIAKVHKSAPSQTLKSALNCLAFSLIFFAIAFLTLFVCSELTALSMFCGLITALFSLYSLRKVDVTDKSGFGFKNLFILYCIWFVMIIAGYSLSPIESFYNVIEDYEDFFGTCGGLLFSLLIPLIRNLIKPYNKQLSKSIISYFVYLVAIFVGIAIFGFFNLFGISLGSTCFSTGLILQILCIDAAFFLVATSLWISRVSQSLYETKHNYIVETSFKKKIIFVTSFALVSLILIGSVDGVYLCKTPEAKTHSIEDYAFENRDDYERICDNLNYYGVPKEVVSNLPKSEISAYSSVADYSGLSEEAKNIINNRCSVAPFTVKNLFEGGLIIEPELYPIPLHTTEKANYVRVLIVFSVSIVDDDYFKTYRDGIFFNVMSENMTDSEDNNEKDDFLMILQRNNETSRYEQVDPFKTLFFYDSGPDKIKGFEFKPEDEMLIVCSKTLKFDDLYETESELNIEYIHKMSSFSFFLRTPEDVFESNEEQNSGYLKKQEDFSFSFAMPEVVCN